MKEQSFKNTIAYIIIFLVAALPAVFSTQVHSVFSAPKLFLLHLVTSLLLLLVGYQAITSKKIEIQTSKWSKYLLFYLLISFLSGVFSINIYSSFFGVEGRFVGTFTLLHLAILTIITISFFPREKIPLLLKTFFFTATAIAIYSLLQHYEFIKLDTIWAQDPTKRAFGSLGHANHLGAYLATAIVVGVGLISQIKLKWQQTAITILSLILFWALITTASRGALAALILSLIFVGVLIVRIKGFNKIICGVISAVVLVIIGISSSNLAVIKRPIQDDRISWWQSSIEIVNDYPVFGTGFSTFKDIYNQYRRSDYVLQDNIQNKITPESAHNEFINTWVTTGLMGLISFLLMIAFAIFPLLRKVWHKNFIKSNREKYLSIGVLGGLAVYILQTQISFGVIPTLTIFYLFLGLAIILAGSGKNIKLKIKSTSQKLLIIGLVLAFAISSLNIGIKRIKSEHYLQAAKAAIMAEDKESYYQKAILSFPWEYTYYTSYADYTIQAIIQKRPDINFNKYINTALSHYEKALKLNNHHPVVHGNYGITLFTYANYQKLLGNTEQYEKYLEKGKQAFEEAIKKGPNNPTFKEHYEKALEKIDQTES